jgi:hypothetical protein
VVSLVRANSFSSTWMYPKYRQPDNHGYFQPTWNVPTTIRSEFSTPAASLRSDISGTNSWPNAEIAKNIGHKHLMS